MYRSTDRLIDCFGTPMVLRRETGDRKVKGFLHHSGSRSWQRTNVEYSPLGKIPEGQYLYIGPAEPVPKVGEELRREDKSFEFRRVETVLLGSRVLYCWGMCVEKGGEVPWGNGTLNG